MKRTALDTNVVVAALLNWHEHHSRAFPVLVAALGSVGGLILPLPVLLESYAVMTRLPPPFRLAPVDAHELLTSAFRGKTTVVSIESSSAWNLLDDLSVSGVAGGAAYDAHILACAQAGGAVRLVTFNRRHFENLGLGALELVTP